MLPEYGKLVDTALDRAARANSGSDNETQIANALVSIAASFSYMVAAERERIIKEKETDQIEDSLCYDHIDELRFTPQCRFPGCENKGRKRI